MRPGADERRGVQALVVRSFFGTAAAVSGVGALLIWLFPGQRRPADSLLAAGMFAGLALLALLGLRARRAQAPAAMAALLALATLTITFTAVKTGWGLAAPGLSFLGLFVCVLCASASSRLGALLAALAAVCVVALELSLRLLGSAGAPAAGPGSGLQLLSHLMLIGAGLASGVMLSQVMTRFLRASDEREQRFRGLLSIAADAYWEIDAQWRLVSATNQRKPLRSLAADDGIGQVPWEMPQFGCDPETLDTLQADLESRLPFRDLAIHWIDAGGQQRHFMVSGEPRFNTRGVFSGFWGVARDVTRDVAARQALKATETRYQELFTRIPTPLVLHRGGRVIDANPSGVALFGQVTLAALIGRDIVAHYESGDSRERARRRVEELEAMPVGHALPIADFRLQTYDGRRLLVRASGVRVETADGPATLSIFVDDTERRLAEDSVRRSEALLSHLVATSPDVITLTDLSTGRYAMVNRTFERLTGYASAEVVGKTSVELGIWSRPDAREAFIGALRERGAVEDLLTQFTTKEGLVVSMQVSGARFAMDRRDYLVINARDISESERARLEREAILENASVGIAVTRDRRFVLANPRFEQMFGWPRGSLLGQSGRVVWASDADYAELGGRYGPALARGETVAIEKPGHRRDGSAFLASITGKAIDPSHPAHGGTIWIVDDVTERRQFEQALARARDEAEAASRAKSAFLANTSHELRTPLNGILNLAQLARATDIEEPRRRQYLEQIAESSQSLADIISDILDLSKIEAGKLELETTTFHLGELLRGVQRAYATLASGRTLDLTLEIGTDVDGLVSGDPLRVRQILGNYLSNALKFTPSGVVRLAARRETGDRVRLEVHDTGDGIDAETRSRLFQPFTQADESTTRRYGGTGLGLSICRELALLMNGEVGVVSEPGLGSQFWAELPLPIARPVATPAAAGGLTEVPLAGARVLMVEDNPVNMMIAVAMLESWGLVVEQTADGREALDAVARHAAEGRAFDVVLMDVQMPVMSGYEATRALRAAEVGGAAHLPIIALTAAALVTERQQALEAGMDDFLTKPIDASKLRSTLARWLQSARQ
jgi:PAS domain S-box-containing protein